MKANCIKFLIFFFIFIAVFSCNDEGVSPAGKLHGGSLAAEKLNSERSSGLASLFASSVFSYFGTYSPPGSGATETTAVADHGYVVVGIGASVNANRNVDRIVLAIRSINAEDGSLGETVEYRGYGSVGQNDPDPNHCEVYIEVPGGHVVTEVGVASQGTNMAHVGVKYREYLPATRRLGSTLYPALPLKDELQPNVTTQRSYTTPASQPIDRTVVTGIGLGCAGSTGQIDGFVVTYGVLE